jgi:hypothetical protein
MKRSIFFLGVLLLSVAMNAQLAIKIGLTGNAAIGDMSDYYGGGPGVDANIKYIIAHKFGLGISTGFQHFFANEWDDEYNDYDDEDFNIIPIHLSFAYYLGTRKFKPYFGAELGINISNLSYSDDYSWYDAYQETWYTDNYDYEYSNTRFGAAPVIGFQVDFGNSKVALDVNAKVNLLSGVDDDNSEKQSATYIGLNLGLVIRLW